jgi:para-nitrobenzyl esterase
VLGAVLTCIVLWAASYPAVVDQISAADGSLTASTTSGPVRGKVTGDADVFSGIPYAAPPVGDLRWRPPRPPVPWSGTRDALQPGSPCPQTGRLASTNEDCLHLNVWAPHDRPSAGLPVMVFLHGGGQRQSAGSEYNPDRLISRGRRSSTCR